MKTFIILFLILYVLLQIINICVCEIELFRYRQIIKLENHENIDSNVTKHLPMSMYITNSTIYGDLKFDLKSKIKNLETKEINKIVKANKKDYEVNLPLFFKDSVVSFDYKLNNDYIFQSFTNKNNMTNFTYQGKLSYSDKLAEKVVIKPLSNFNESSQININDLSIKPCVEFEIEQPDVKLEFTKTIISPLSSSSNNLNFLDSIVVGNFIIGINKNKTLSMYKFNFYEENILFQLEIFFNEDNWGIQKAAISLKRIFYHNKIIALTDEKGDVYIIEIENNSPNFYSYDTLNLKQVIKFLKDVIPIDNKIKKFVSKDKFYIFALEGSGIMILQKYAQKILIKDFKSKTYNKTIDLKIKDMEIINNSVYVVIENHGLKILNFNISDKNATKLSFTEFEFIHPYIKSVKAFDSYAIINKKNTKILSLVFDTNFVNEFYMELNLQYEFNPSIFRVFLTETKREIEYIFSVGEFSYFLEIDNDKNFNKNKLLLIKQPFIDFKDDYAYEFQLENYGINSNSKIYPLKIEEKIVFLYDNTVVFSNKAYFKSGNIKFVFNEEGNYDLSLSTFSDNCRIELDENNLESDLNDLCTSKLIMNFSIDANFSNNVIQKFMEDNFPIIIALFILLSFLQIFVYFKCYRGEDDSKTHTATKGDKNGPYIQGQDVEISSTENTGSGRVKNQNSNYSVEN